MTTGCGFGLTDDDDDAGGRHTKGENSVSVYDQLKKMMATLDDETYCRMVAELEEEKKAPPSLDGGAELLAQSQNGGMRIPGGSLTPRMRRMLADANGGDTFRIDRDQAQNIDLSQ